VASAAALSAVAGSPTRPPRRRRRRGCDPVAAAVPRFPHLAPTTLPGYGAVLACRTGGGGGDVGAGWAMTTPTCGARVAAVRAVDGGRVSGGAAVSLAVRAAGIVGAPMAAPSVSTAAGVATAGDGGGGDRDATSVDAGEEADSERGLPPRSPTPPLGRCRCRVGHGAARS